MFDPYVPIGNDDCVHFSLCLILGRCNEPIEQVLQKLKREVQKSKLRGFPVLKGCDFLSFLKKIGEMRRFVRR